MFTGIVAATGEVADIAVLDGDWRIRITSAALDPGGLSPGDSVAVSGVCLTALRSEGGSFLADVSRETLACTTLGELRQGALVNLELALRPQDRLGGHFVTGHVDGIGELLTRVADGRSERLVFRVPEALAKYIARKGSVCIDGVSLTVNDVRGAEFDVNIIPHTAERTTLREFRPGRKVNIEVDLLSRYLERLLQQDGGATGQADEALARADFVGKE